MLVYNSQQHFIVSSIMSLIHNSQPRSRGSNRNNYQNYMGSSVNRRNDVNLLSQNYNNYYGAPSLSKDYKPSYPSTGSYLSHLTSSTQQQATLPKIASTTQKKDQMKRRNLYSRQSPTKASENHHTPSLVQSDIRRVGQAGRQQQLARNKQSETGLSYLKSLPEQKQIPLRQSRKQTQDIFKQTKPKTLGLVGLNNIGNTCFMNSILQCMLNLPKFNEYFLNNQHHKEMTSSSRVAIAYGKLVQLIRSSTSRAETPSDIKNAVSSKKSRFMGYGQQDAQEFLLALLELISSELNRSKNPKYKELKADLSKNTLQQISDQWWAYNRQRQNSIVCDYFAGQILSKVVCGSCGNESIAFDNIWDIDINFSHNDYGDILRMIQNFLKEQTISSDYYCSKCKAFKECKRKLYLYRLPQILVLQIKRFSYGKYSKQKLNHRIKAPTTLNLSKLVTTSQHPSVKNPVYELVGVVNHSGEINFGHYTADCKNPINGKWYHFNDSSVSEMSMGEQVDSSSPYLLFYSKL